MNRPAIIVQPFSSGVDLAPAFKARGIPVIAITLPHCASFGYGAKLQQSDFIEVIPEQPNLIKLLTNYNPLAIIPGSEVGISLADSLAAILTPDRANDPGKSRNRGHKALMQNALKEAGVPVLATIHTSSEKEVELWIEEQQLSNATFIMKPPMSAGSDKVFHTSVKDDWKQAFNQILMEPCPLTRKLNETVVVQEEAIGTEFAVGTVSANGTHYLAHLIKYNKMTSHNRKTIYDHVEFIPYIKDLYEELFSYTQKTLDALGVCWGAAHNEIILTNKGPRLIETSTRMCGGPVISFSRAATGSSQADKLVEIYIDGDVKTPEYQFKKSVVPVFLKSPKTGTIANMEAFTDLSKLPTFLSEHIWYENGDLVPQTIDYLTNIGIIALTGERKSIFLDYTKIRHMESQLMVL